MESPVKLDKRYSGQSAVTHAAALAQAARCRGPEPLPQNAPTAGPVPEAPHAVHEAT